MAYVAHSVYEKGIENEVFGEDKIYIALASGDREATGTDDDFLKKVLAVSELRSGSGTNNNTEEQTEPSDEHNNVGEFSNKVLSLLSVAYNRTKSVEGDNTNFSHCTVNSTDAEKNRNATHFAIIKFTGTVTPLTAYEKENGAGGLIKITFNGPTITADNVNAGQHKVLIVGNLTSRPIINQDSNFMFGGAKITFTEA